MPQLIAALCLAGLLQACGQTGPLYMPDETPPTETANDSETESTADTSN